MAELTLFEFLRTTPTPAGAVRSEDLVADTSKLADAILPQWEASALSSENAEYTHKEMIHRVLKGAIEIAGVPPPDSALEPLVSIVYTLIKSEALLTQKPAPPPAGLTYAELLDERARLMRMQKLLAAVDDTLNSWVATVAALMGYLIKGLPEADDDALSTESALVDLRENVAEDIDAILGQIFNNERELLDAGFLGRVSDRLFQNLLTASDITERQLRANPNLSPKSAQKQRDMTNAELVETYLGGTPLADMFRLPWPVSIPQRTRFEHHWIVAGSGHGKTQTLQYLITQDLVKVAGGNASIIVIDSQGELIRNLSTLQYFGRGEPLDGKLCLIDPTDIEYPVALNLFDVGRERLTTYSALERERLINGVIELYDFVLASLLSAELTQKQGIVFRYVLRLLLEIPDANIQTLRQLMEPGASERFKPYIAKLTGTARAFFDNEFNSRQFEDTKRQVIRRLYGILENRTFERMFSHPRNKLDLFTEMNAGKVILINTAKDLLKQQGTEIFGRFFIAMIAQAAQERAVLPKEQRTPTFVYIDECQDYVDTNVALILEQARKFNVGLILAHQYVGQLAPKLQESFAANTSIKFAGGVSDKDARSLAHMLRCEPAFIERQPKGAFAAFARNVTDKAISMRFPFGFLEGLPHVDERDPAFEELRDDMREKYAVPYTAVEQSISAHLDVPASDDPDSVERTQSAARWGSGGD